MGKMNGVAISGSYEEGGSMARVKLGPRIPSLALPICLLGANYDGKPNFCTVAWFTMIDDDPPQIGLVLGKKRRTKDGILQNKTFSVSIPCTRMVERTDYCGIHAGEKVDKSEVFSVSYGELETAPIIEDCPLVMECRLKEILPFEGVDLVIGDIVQVHAEEFCLVNGKPDVRRMDPLLYAMPGGPYLSIGEKVADAFKVGRSLKPRPKEKCGDPRR